VAANEVARIFHERQKMTDWSKGICGKNGINIHYTRTESD
jgi:hypothetical protein